MKTALFITCTSPNKSLHLLMILWDNNTIVIPPNSNTFSDWRRTRHVSWVKTRQFLMETTIATRTFDSRVIRHTKGSFCTLRDLSQDPKKKLFISESLTQARKKLFGSINKFKKDNKWKYIWTNNGRIYLKQGDGDRRTFTFNYADEFADFKSKFSPG